MKVETEFSGQTESRREEAMDDKVLDADLFIDPIAQLFFTRIGEQVTTLFLV